MAEIWLKVELPKELTDMTGMVVNMPVEFDPLFKYYIGHWDGYLLTIPDSPLRIAPEGNVYGVSRYSVEK